MPLDPTQALLDASCNFECIPPGYFGAALLAQLMGASVVATASFSPAGAAVQVLAPNPKRRLAVLENTSPVTQAFLGPSTVTNAGSTLGLVLDVSGSVNSRFTFLSTGELWAFSTGTTVRVIEFSVP